MIFQRGICQDCCSLKWKSHTFSMHLIKCIFCHKWPGVLCLQRTQQHLIMTHGPAALKPHHWKNFLRNTWQIDGCSNDFTCHRWLFPQTQQGALIYNQSVSRYNHFQTDVIEHQPDVCAQACDIQFCNYEKTKSHSWNCKDRLGVEHQPFHYAV